MPQIKREYFIKGVDIQKRSDLTFLFKRLEISKLLALSKEDKNKVMEFISQCQMDLQETASRINNSII